MSSERDSRKSKSALTNPIYWIVAFVVVVILRWDEISGWFH